MMNHLSFVLLPRMVPKIRSGSMVPRFQRNHSKKVGTFSSGTAGSTGGVPLCPKLVNDLRANPDLS